MINLKSIYNEIELYKKSVIYYEKYKNEMHRVERHDLTKDFPFKIFHNYDKHRLLYPTFGVNEKIKETWNGLDVKKINIFELIWGQGWLRYENLNEYYCNKPIAVAKYKKHYFIEDGHHRVFRDILRGKRMIESKILELR